jgi:N6-adenosine-specific RNA methylase IME4
VSQFSSFDACLDRYGTILVNARWKVRSPADPSSLTATALKELPVGRLADRRLCHAYLWATDKIVPTALRILDAWGFAYVETLVCVRENQFSDRVASRHGYYCSAAVKYLLFGRCGSAARKRVMKFPEYHEDRIHSMIEERSPGPYLELFASSAVQGWDHWGLRDAASDKTKAAAAK